MGSLFDAHMHLWIQSFPASSIVQSTSTTLAHRETRYLCLLASSLSSSCVLLISPILLSSTCSSRILHWLIFACSSCLRHHESMGKIVCVLYSWSLRMRLCFLHSLISRAPTVSHGLSSIRSLLLLVSLMSAPCTYIYIYIYIYICFSFLFHNSTLTPIG